MAMLTCLIPCIRYSLKVSLAKCGIKRANRILLTVPWQSPMMMTIPCIFIQIPCGCILIKTEKQRKCLPITMCGFFVKICRVNAIRWHTVCKIQRSGFINDPVLWSGVNQLTADSINIVISENQVDSLVMYNTAFIVSKDSLDLFQPDQGKKYDWIF